MWSQIDQKPPNTGEYSQSYSFDNTVYWFGFHPYHLKSKISLLQPSDFCLKLEANQGPSKDAPRVLMMTHGWKKLHRCKDNEGCKRQRCISGSFCGENQPPPNLLVLQPVPKRIWWRSNPGISPSSRIYQPWGPWDSFRAPGGRTTKQTYQMARSK